MLVSLNNSMTDVTGGAETANTSGAHAFLHSF